MDSLSLSIRHLKGNPGPGAYYRDFQVGLKTNESRKRERLKAKAKAKAKARMKKEREAAEEATQRQVRNPHLILISLTSSSPPLVRSGGSRRRRKPRSTLRQSSRVATWSPWMVSPRMVRPRGRLLLGM